MKLLFVSILYPKESFEQLRDLASGCIQNAPNVFQWGVVDGLLKNNVDFEVVSLPGLPAYPLKYKKLFTLSGDVKAEGKVIGKMLRYCDLVGYKTFSMRCHLKKYLFDWAERNSLNGEQLVILTYTPYFPFLQAVKKIKKYYPNIIIASIVTDLVDDMFNFESNRSILKRIQSSIEIKKTKRLYSCIDKFVLLTEPMKEKIPEADGRYIVIEGIATPEFFQKQFKDCKLRTLLYTGTLEEFSGVRDLINAFSRISNDDFRLIICGGGSLETFVKEQALKDTRIIFKGLVPREEAVILQQRATALINPRKPNSKITRFSFPSKTMEYLSSGTPMIGYKLDGIPSEYYDYFYTIDDSSEKSLRNTIVKVLSLPQEALDEKAFAAHQFIESHKTSKIQVKKILDFLSE